MSDSSKGCIHCSQHGSNQTTGICPECGASSAGKRICRHCGYSAHGDFLNDLCPECGYSYWECGNCKRIVAATSPPATCPACKEKCDFKNVTCYTPECGGPGNIDHRLI